MAMKSHFLTKYGTAFYTAVISYEATNYTCTCALAHSPAYGGLGWSGQPPQQMNQPVHHLDQPCN